jgi:hypothetical protein
LGASATPAPEARVFSGTAPKLVKISFSKCTCRRDEQQILDGGREKRKMGTRSKTKQLSEMRLRIKGLQGRRGGQVNERPLPPGALEGALYCRGKLMKIDLLIYYRL